MQKKNARGYTTMKDNRLQAVHDDDLTALLRSLGCYEKVLSKQCTCLFCEGVITIGNLGAIIPVNGEITFSCDSPVCLNAMMEAGNTNDSK